MGHYFLDIQYDKAMYLEEIKYCMEAPVQRTDREAGQRVLGH